MFKETLGHVSQGTHSESSCTMEVPCCQLLERGVVPLRKQEGQVTSAGSSKPSLSWCKLEA